MAETTGRANSIQELKQEIAHSRVRLARDLSGLRYELDFPLRFRKSFQRKTTLWVSAAALIGAIFSFLPGRKGRAPKRVAEGKKEAEKKGLLGAAMIFGLRFAVGMLKPAIARYVAGRLAEQARRRS
jgi:hypothetical protein